MMNSSVNPENLGIGDPKLEYYGAESETSSNSGASTRYPRNVSVPEILIRVKLAQRSFLEHQIITAAMHVGLQILAR
jgi:hypothetical protein